MKLHSVKSLVKVQYEPYLRDEYKVDEGWYHIDLERPVTVDQIINARAIKGYLESCFENKLTLAEAEYYWNSFVQTTPDTNEHDARSFDEFLLKNYLEI